MGLKEEETKVQLYPWKSLLSLRSKRARQMRSKVRVISFLLAWNYECATEGTGPVRVTELAVAS